VRSRPGALEDFLTPSPAFWGGKRVFLTGQTGFKGTWLGLWLTQLGATVRGYALPPDAGNNLCVAAGLADRIESLHGDIRDASALDAAMSGFMPDIVLHLAAQALVQKSYRDPVATFEINVTGTIRVLEAVRRCPTVRATVVVTTDKCYENREWVWAYRETEALGGRDPYSASKACTEIAVAAWRASFFDGTPVALASARAGNVIGGGDWAEDRLIPDCIRAMTCSRAIEVRSPNATRPWQHVLEPLCGYLLLAERLWDNESMVAEAWNFGPAMIDVKPVGEIVERVTRLWGDGASWLTVGAEGGHEAGLLAVDAAKAQTRLLWQPRLRLQTALEWTIGWYKRHQAGEDARALVLEDIARYELNGSAYP
jgi:CDP-glucose 4,6-dehydratase